MGVRVHCRTAIDCAKMLEWPKELDGRPMIGDHIRSLSSTPYKQIELKVVGCKWLTNGSMEVDLHLINTRFETIADFEKWLKKPDSEIKREIDEAFRPLDQAQFDN